MARPILPKRTKNLNLSPEQVTVFEELLETGCQMAKALENLDQTFDIKHIMTYEDQWSELLVRFAYLRLDEGCESK